MYIGILNYTYLYIKHAHNLVIGVTALINSPSHVKWENFILDLWSHAFMVTAPFLRVVT